MFGKIDKKAGETTAYCFARGLVRLGEGCNLSFSRSNLKLISIYFPLKTPLKIINGYVT